MKELETSEVKKNNYNGKNKKTYRKYKSVAAKSEDKAATAVVKEKASAPKKRSTRVKKAVDSTVKEVGAVLEGNDTSIKSEVKAVEQETKSTEKKTTRSRSRKTVESKPVKSKGAKVSAKNNEVKKAESKIAPKKESDDVIKVEPTGISLSQDGLKGVKIIPLGGLEQIGMNIIAFEYEDSIIVVDCGLSFPDDEMLGIDLVIPDVTYLKDNIEKVKGFVITHGHEDHIGALPYVLKEVNVPIYATKLTMGIIENKLKEHNLMKATKRKVIKYGQSINLGCFRIEFIRTNHSIADSAALAIYSPAGIVVHTGDFKVDYTPVFGDAIDLQRFAELGKKGVLALMCDSTNAERPGFTPSEKTVGVAFDNIFYVFYINTSNNKFCYIQRQQFYRSIKFHEKYVWNKQTSIYEHRSFILLKELYNNDCYRNNSVNATIKKYM